MEEEQLSFLLLNSLQELANKSKLSDISMVTGFTLCVEGVDEDSTDQIITVHGPFDYVTKTLGHVEYLRISVGRQVGTSPLD